MSHHVVVSSTDVMSHAHRASQRSLPCGSFTVRTSSPVIPILGLLSDDWVPWASKRTRGGYIGKTVGEITDPPQKKDLLSALHFGNTVPATGMFRGLAGHLAEEVSKRRGIRVGSGADSWYERELNSHFGFCFPGKDMWIFWVVHTKRQPCGPEASPQSRIPSSCVHVCQSVVSCTKLLICCCNKENDLWPGWWISACCDRVTTVKWTMC